MHKTSMPSTKKKKQKKQQTKAAKPTTEKIGELDEGIERPLPLPAARKTKGNYFAVVAAAVSIDCIY